MHASKMCVFTRAFVLMSVFASAAFASAPLSDSHFTETAAPQEIGSITADGFLVYSMNYCTIVQNTECQVSLSTGGAAPPPAPSTGAEGGHSTATNGETYPPGEPTGTDAASSGDYAPPPTSRGEGPSAPGESGGPSVSEHPGESSAPGEPAPSYITTTDAEGHPTTVSQGEGDATTTHTAPASGHESSKTHTGGSKTDSKPTETDKDGEPTGTSSGTPTAGAVLNNAPAFVLGIAGVVGALLV